MTKKIVIDGVIGNGPDEISSQMVKAQLPQEGNEPIEIHIHSEGGSVFEGFAIHDALKSYPGRKKCIIASSAFSIASFIPMACDEVEITPNGYMMLHLPYSESGGTADDLRGKAVLLEQMESAMIEAYCGKTKKDADYFQKILSDETFLNATQCLEYGLVDRITQTPITGRVFAKLESMPHGIVCALFGAGPRGEKCETTEEKLMSNTQPAAATIQQIKAAFPLAKADFIVKCLEKNLSMDLVAQQAATEMMNENQELLARISAMEEEITALKAASSTTAVPTMNPDIEEDEYEDKAKAKAKTPVAKASGVKPVAKAQPTGGISARSRWNELVAEAVRGGVPKFKAASIVNRQNPGLREQMLAEANG